RGVLQDAIVTVVGSTAQPVGSKTRLGRQDVLANHTTKTIATLDTSLAPRRCRRERWAWRVGRREGQRSVRSVDVVMIHEKGEDALKMLSGSGSRSNRG